VLGDKSVVSKSAAKLLKAQDIIPLGEKERQEQKKSALTTVLVCVHCKTPNKPNAKFCSNVQCGMILNWETHIEKVRESESHMKELAELKAQQKIEEESKFKEINKKMELMSKALGMSKLVEDFDREQRRLESRNPMLRRARNEVRHD
jgi:hypothetical protein